MLYRSYFSKNATLIENNRTNNSKNPVTEIFYGTLSSNVSRYIFDIDLEPLINKINDGEIKSNQIIKHTLKLVNTIRFSPERIGTTLSDQTTQRASSFDLEIYNIDEDWDEGTGYDFVYIDEQYPNIPQKPVNWYDRKINTPWTIEGGFDSGSTQIIGTQNFIIGNEDIEIDITNYVNDLITGSTGTSYGLGIKYPSHFELLETKYRQAVAFHIKNTTTFFEPYVETEYDNNINDDRNYFFLDKDNDLFLYSKVGGKPMDVTVNSVDILDYEDEVVTTLTGDSITNIKKGVNKITINIDSDTYPDAVLFTDRWNITQNGKSKAIDQEFYLISQDNYYNFTESNRLLSDNYYFQFKGIKQGEKIKKGGLRKIYINTKELYKPNQDNNLSYEIEYNIFSSQNDKYTFDVIPWTKVDRTNSGYEFTIDTSWLIPQEYSIQIRMVQNNIMFVKEKIDFSVINDAITGA